ncbi:MAG: alpha/beta fold hydrolase [Flavobacteriaceae bacterium]|jgi:pimeloyl-ACP methyl ester carboxylesterase|nr:alpha/beta fold hydrolase [Flavobacteriaceae bacterium]
MRLLTKKTILLQRGDDKPILCDATIPTGEVDLPLVIFCHGYKGFKDWGAWEQMMDIVAEASRCYVVRFNFSKNGTTVENPTEFVDLEAFGQNTYTQEQKDLSCVIDYFKSKRKVNAAKIFLVGHSRGGGAVLLQGYFNKDIYGVVTLAGVSDYRKRFPHGERFVQWKDKGVFYVENARTKQQLPHYISFWNDYEQNEEQLNVQYAAQHLRKPVLIVQGTADVAVPQKEGELLKQWMPQAELCLIEGADHVFGTKHPFEDVELPAHAKEVVEVISAFLKKNTK